MSMTGLAHGASLPLFALLQRMDGKTTLEAINDTRNGIEALELNDHIEVVLLFEKSHIRINIEPLTDFGVLIVTELKSRNEFPPCDPGTCDMDSQGFCKWCGNAAVV